ncbi:MAG: hypothetical protein ABR906_01750 [Terracidiphilus sp.]
MRIDSHQIFQQIIDKSLADAISPQEEKSLREHLLNCVQCQDYLSSGARVIASLGGFSFDANPELQAKVCESLKARAQQLEARQFTQSRWTRSCIAALMLTAAGTFADLQFGKLAAALLGIQPMLVRQDLFAFWVVPSLCLLLLFPMLPAILAANTNRKGNLL